MQARISAALALTCFALGCASVDPSHFVPRQLPAGRVHDASLAIEFRQVGPRHALYDEWPEGVEPALRSGLLTAGLFRALVKEDADYELRVVISHLIFPPSSGVSYRCQTTSRWTLTRTSDGKVVMDEPIYGEFTATVGDALYGLRRSFLAIEGAVRVTLEQGIAALSGVDL